MLRFRPVVSYRSCVTLGSARRRIAPEKSEMGQKGERREEAAESLAGTCLYQQCPQIMEKMTPYYVSG